MRSSWRRVDVTPLCIGSRREQRTASGLGGMVSSASLPFPSGSAERFLAGVEIGERCLDRRAWRCPACGARPRAAWACRPTQRGCLRRGAGQAAANRGGTWSSSLLRSVQARRELPRRLSRRGRATARWRSRNRPDLRACSAARFTEACEGSVAGHRTERSRPRPASGQGPSPRGVRLPKRSSPALASSPLRYDRPTAAAHAPSPIGPCPLPGVTANTQIQAGASLRGGSSNRGPAPGPAQGIRRGLRRRAATVADMRLPLPRLIGGSRRHRVLVLEWLQGDSLQGALENGTWSGAGVTEAAGVLAALHSRRVDGLPSWSPSLEASKLRAAAEAVAVTLPDLEEPALQLARRLGGDMSQTGRSGRLIHADLSPDQVIISRDSSRIIDVDSAMCGPPGWDLATFAAALERDVILGRVTTQVAEAVRDQFLGAYTRAAPMTVRLDDRLVAAALLRLAPEPFRRRETDWTERTEAIVERVTELAGNG